MEVKLFWWSFCIYTYIKSLCCTLKINAMLNVNYISIKKWRRFCQFEKIILHSVQLASVLIHTSTTTIKPENSSISPKNPSSWARPHPNPNLKNHGSSRNPSQQFLPFPQCHMGKNHTVCHLLRSASVGGQFFTALRGGSILHCIVTLPVTAFIPDYLWGPLRWSFQGRLLKWRSLLPPG